VALAEAGYLPSPFRAQQTSNLQVWGSNGGCGLGGNTMHSAYPYLPSSGSGAHQPVEDAGKGHYPPKTPVASQRTGSRVAARSKPSARVGPVMRPLLLANSARGSRPTVPDDSKATSLVEHAGERHGLWPTGAYLPNTCHLAGWPRCPFHGARTAARPGRSLDKAHSGCRANPLAVLRRDHRGLVRQHPAPFSHALPRR
jgi:hypothetical protein